MFSKTMDEIWLNLQLIEDERSANFPLISNFWLVIFMSVFYVVLVTFLGPAFMKARKAYNIQKVVLCYNLFQVFLSLYIFQGFAFGGWLTGYNYICQPQDFTKNTKSDLMVRSVYLFFLSKFAEWPETVFFVLRKKQEQVNFLHVYHHTIVVPTTWMMTKYSSTGHATFPGLINSFIHVIMYAYYFLSAFGPSTRRYLWWKNYLTALQIIQFILVMVHHSIPLIVGCNFSKVILWYNIILSLGFLILFVQFYKRTYKKTEQEPTEIS